jgi:hypothetical protein
MAVPRCPNPTHSKARVVRAGWHGAAPHRRQRWLCRPANGDAAHRFTEELPRRQAVASHCSECSSVLDPWEGQAGAREYAFSARDVAHALALVANGSSYRRAAEATRVAARRARGGTTYGPARRKRLVERCECGASPAARKHDQTRPPDLAGAWCRIAV